MHNKTISFVGNIKNLEREMVKIIEGGPLQKFVTL